mgnify:CR=1 FL=1
MNVCAAVETAMAEVLRQFAELGENVTIRQWRGLNADGSWDADKDRSFPMVDIRCSTPRTDGDERTHVVDCPLLLGTNTDDDRDHAQINALEDAAQTVVDRIYDGFWKSSTSEYETFAASLSANVPAGVNIGGITIGDGLAPMVQNGVNMVGITLRVHFSR